MDRQAESRMDRMRRLDHIRLLFTPQSMLGSEQRRQLFAKPACEQIHRQLQVAVDRSLIAQQANSRAMQFVAGCSEEALKTNLNALAYHLFNCSTHIPSSQTTQPGHSCQSIFKNPFPNARH